MIAFTPQLVDFYRRSESMKSLKSAILTLSTQNYSKNRILSARMLVQFGRKSYHKKRYLMGYKYFKGFYKKYFVSRELHAVKYSFIIYIRICAFFLILIVFQDYSSSENFILWLWSAIEIRIWLRCSPVQYLLQSVISR